MRSIAVKDAGGGAGILVFHTMLENSVLIDLARKKIGAKSLLVVEFRCPGLR